MDRRHAVAVRERLPFDARKGVDIFAEVVALVDRVQRALEAVRAEQLLLPICARDIQVRVGERQFFAALDGLYRPKRDAGAVDGDLG